MLVLVVHAHRPAHRDDGVPRPGGQRLALVELHAHELVPALEQDVLEDPGRLARDVLQDQDAHQTPDLRAEARGFALEDVPGQAHVGLGRPAVADREPQDVPAVEPRVREVGLAARVDGLEQRLAARVLALRPEAHDRVGARRADLPARLVAHPALEQLREADVLADRLLQPRPAEAAQHRPQLQCAEAPAERRAVLVQIGDALGGGAQVLGREREGRPQIVGPRREEAGSSRPG